MKKNLYRIILFDRRIGYSVFEKNLTEEDAKEQVRILRNQNKLPAFMHPMNIPLFPSKKLKKVI